jgi:hypothetical protein
MEHRLVTAIEKALGWDGPALLGAGFAQGELLDTDLPLRLMTPNRLLDLVESRHLANPQLRMYAEGEELHPSRYLTEVVNRRRQAVKQADMAAVGVALNNGGTLVLDSVDTFDRTIQAACRALGWWSGELVSANMYLAVGDTAGFDLHWDDHDVICVQLAGQKSWEVRGASRPHPMYRDAERNTEPAEDVVWAGTMNPGDVMHIPRGFWHTATRVGSGEGHSLHVTFGITKRTGVAWLNHLSDIARAVPHRPRRRSAHRPKAAGHPAGLHRGRSQSRALPEGLARDRSVAPSPAVCSSIRRARRRLDHHRVRPRHHGNEQRGRGGRGRQAPDVRRTHRAGASNAAVGPPRRAHRRRRGHEVIG